MRAIDAGGNVDASPASFTWTVAPRGSLTVTARTTANATVYGACYTLRDANAVDIGTVCDADDDLSDGITRFVNTTAGAVAFGSAPVWPK